MLCCYHLIFFNFLFCSVFLPCPASWFHGPDGKNEGSAIWNKRPIQSAATARAFSRSTTRAWLPWTGLCPTRSPEISSGNARPDLWRHGGHAVWSTGIIFHSGSSVLSLITVGVFEALVCLYILFRWDLMASREQEAMALRARHPIMANQARLLTQVSNKPHIHSLHLDNPEASHHTQVNPILPRLLLHTPREGHLISSPTCPHSPRGHCQAHPKGPHSHSPLILKLQPHSLASLPTPSSRVLPVRPSSSPTPSLTLDRKASPATQDQYRGPSSHPHSNSNHSLIHSSHQDTTSTHKGSLQVTPRTLNSSKHNSHLISAFLLLLRRYQSQSWLIFILVNEFSLCGSVSLAVYLSARSFVYQEVSQDSFQSNAPPSTQPKSGPEDGQGRPSSLPVSYASYNTAGALLFHSFPSDIFFLQLYYIYHASFQKHGSLWHITFKIHFVLLMIM